MSGKPLVSAIIPTKNSAAVLKACLQSIESQIYDNIEIIVIDNHSTDSTLKIAREFTSNVFTKGPERSTQRNFGVSKARGDYVVIIDSDMELSPQVIGDCITAAKQESQAVIIPEESFGEGFWAQCKKLERSFYINVPWMEAARFFNKQLYLQVGGYDESMISGEDWDLSQRIAPLTQIGRIKHFIYHNEGRLRLLTTLKKKYYYAQQFAKYHGKTESKNVGSQTSVLQRYKLFLSRPGILFRRPLIGLGMLGMKTAEFAVGAAGLLRARVSNVSHT